MSGSPVICHNCKKPKGFKGSSEHTIGGTVIKPNARDKRLGLALFVCALFLAVSMGFLGMRIERGPAATTHHYPEHK
ncbi:MAG: hypothetical protein K2Z81_09185 [Cyanobacteria bacterium]|nr:hypothetical protein [Cyanobacteriota bacterium]